jgi:hypothetical protein
MVLRKAFENLAIELGMRLPRLAGDDSPIANGWLGLEPPAGLFDLVAHVDVAGDLAALDETRRDQHLEAVADRKDALSGGVE